MCMVRLHCTQPIWSLSLGFEKKKQQRLLRDTDFPSLPKRSSEHNGAEVHRAEPLWGYQHPPALPTASMAPETMKVINTWKSFSASPKACVTGLSVVAGSGWVGLLRAPLQNATTGTAGMAWITLSPNSHPFI